MAASVTASQHVPAWKRLGLKLKYAKDTVTDSGSSPKVHIVSSSDEVDIANPAKRPRDADGQREPSNKRSKVIPDSEQPIKVHDLAHDNRQTSEAVTCKGRRKSVTFTSDTKTDDGFSATTLYQNWLANEDGFQSPAQAYIENHVVTAPKQEPATTQQNQKPKRDKSKSKTDKVAKAARVEKQSDSTETPDFVKYLVQFHEDSSNWKFHKKKQNELIKHCFDLNRIPTEHTPALVQYVKGLQGLGIQQRLLDSSEKILQDLLAEQDRSGEIEGMESSRARKAAYDAALQRRIDRIEHLGGVRSEYEADTLAEIDRKTAAENRANAVLEELLLKELGRPAPIPMAQTTTPAVLQTPDGAQDTPYQNMISRAAPKRTTFDDDDDDAAALPIKTPAKRRRIRKSRTNVARGSSSSSSSSEDGSSVSDTDSDSSSTATPAQPQTGKKKNDAEQSKPQFFDKDLLDAAFPGSRSTADQTRALAEAHATRDEGGSESQSESESDSDSGSDDSSNDNSGSD